MLKLADELDNMKRLANKLIPKLAISIWLTIFFFHSGPVFVATAQVPLSEEEIRALYNIPSDQELLDEATKKLPLVINISPKNPNPNENVNISIDSYYANLDRSFITWTLNGRIIKSGNGEKSVSFTTGSLGNVSNIYLTIETIDGKTHNESIRIVPSEIDLLWEAETYTPWFYKGKALFSREAVVKVVADAILPGPGGQILSNSNVLYKWKINGKIRNDLSGYGKNVVFIKGTILAESINVEVEVSDVSGSISALKRRTIPVSSPAVIIYEDDPLEGVLFNKAVFSSLDLLGKEVALNAYPFFFGEIADKDKDLEYLWIIDGKTVAGNLTSKIILRNENVGSGQSAVAVNVSHKKSIFQKAGSSFRIFYENNNDSFFNF